jgi:hypothetical protein
MPTVPTRQAARPITSPLPPLSPLWRCPLQLSFGLVALAALAISLWSLSHLARPAHGDQNSRQTPVPAIYETPLTPRQLQL